MEEEPNLRRMYARTTLTMPRSSVLNGFPPLVGPAVDLSQSTDINNPERMNIDATYFLMLTLDLPDLFGIMARSANRRVKIRDLEEFADWFHVISIPIVVRVFADSDEDERDRFRI